MQENEKEEVSSRNSFLSWPLVLGVVTLVFLVCITVVAIVLVVSPTPPIPTQVGQAVVEVTPTGELAQTADQLEPSVTPSAEATPLNPQTGGKSAGDTYIPELGNTGYEYVDMVRERSNMLPLSEAKPGLSPSEFLTQLQHERVVELAEECVRYFDLRRWGLYDNNNTNDTDFETWTSEDRWANIPLEEREVNPNLTSNPGY